MWPRLRSLWRNTVHRRRADRDLEDEIAVAFDLAVDEQIRRGVDPGRARRQAVLQFGRPIAIASEVRERRAGAALEILWKDVAFGGRLLRRSPLFALTVIASLALGIGATTTIFTLVNALMLRDLRVGHPEQLVEIARVTPYGRGGSFSYPIYRALRDHNTVFNGMVAISRSLVQADLDTSPAPIGRIVLENFFEVMQVPPQLGRLIGSSDRESGAATAVLSHAFWQRQFGAAPAAIGQSLVIEKAAFTIVGVLPASFGDPAVGRAADFYIPMAGEPRTRRQSWLTRPDFNWLAIRLRNTTLAGVFATYPFGRVNVAFRGEPDIAEGIHVTGGYYTTLRLTPAAGRLLDANDDRSGVAVAVLGHRYWQRRFGGRLRLESGARGNASDLRRRYEQWLSLLMAILGAVLLLASLNLATLLLSRSDARQREMATRIALGAGRWRLVRQLLSETVVLAAAAGVLAFAAAAWGGRTLLAVATPSADRPPIELAPDWRLAVFTLSVASAVCLIMGLLPSLRATSSIRLAASRQVGGGRQRRLLDRGLVAAQVALSLVLLVAAGLFVRTLENLWSQNPGYARQNVLMFSIDPRLAGKTGDAVRTTYHAVLESLKTVPGAQSATVSAVRPVSDNYYFIDSFNAIGDKTLPPDQAVRVAYNMVAPGYFSTLGIPLIAGRDFDDRDRAGSPAVTIVSERMARHFAGSPLGQRLGSAEVIGVVGDVRYGNVRDQPREVVYNPIFQQQGKDMWYSPTFEVRAAGPASGLIGPIRDAVSGVDPALTLFRVWTLDRQTEDSFARERLLALLAIYFGGFAVLLACIGLYGLMSYAVTQRTAEIGLRMALGATPGSVRWLAVRESAWTVLAGALVGMLGSYAVVRTVQSQLFGVEPRDPAVFAAATALLLTLAMAAAFFPARRATRIDPLVALRHE